MVFEGSIAKKWLGQGKSWNAVGDDLDGLFGNGGADDLTKQTKSGLSGLGDGGNVGLDSVARGPVGCHAMD